MCKFIAWGKKLKEKKVRGTSFFLTEGKELHINLPDPAEAGSERSSTTCLRPGWIQELNRKLGFCRTRGPPANASSNPGYSAIVHARQLRVM